MLWEEYQFHPVTKSVVRWYLASKCVVHVNRSFLARHYMYDSYQLFIVYSEACRRVLSLVIEGFSALNSFTDTRQCDGIEL